MTRVGVIDVGTNSVRMLVAERNGNSISDLARDLVITRLGEGVDKERILAPRPVMRTMDAIKRYAERCRAAGAARVRIICTSAVRDAGNREAFLYGVSEVSGITPDLLSGEEEAHLGFAGATIAIDAPPPYLVCDIGGGSTELVLGAKTAERFISLDIGSVRLTERHVQTDPPKDDEVEAMRSDARAQLDRAAAVLGDTQGATLVGLAGTITTAAAVMLELEGYDRDAIHHARMSRQEVASIRARLAGMTSAERRGLPAMPSGREDVIVGGIVILEEVMDRFGATQCVVSETDILDGTALALMDS